MGRAARDYVINEVDTEFVCDFQLRVLVAVEFIFLIILL